MTLKRTRKVKCVCLLLKEHYRQCQTGPLITVEQIHLFIFVSLVLQLEKEIEIQRERHRDIILQSQCFLLANQSAQHLETIGEKPTIIQGSNFENSSLSNSSPPINEEVPKKRKRNKAWFPSSFLLPSMVVFGGFI